MGINSGCSETLQLAKVKLAEKHFLLVSHWEVSYFGSAFRVSVISHPICWSMQRNVAVRWSVFKVKDFIFRMCTGKIIFIEDFSTVCPDGGADFVFLYLKSNINRIKPLKLLIYLLSWRPCFSFLRRAVTFSVSFYLWSCIWYLLFDFAFSKKRSQAFLYTILLKIHLGRPGALLLRVRDGGIKLLGPF